MRLLNKGILSFLILLISSLTCIQSSMANQKSLAVPLRVQEQDQWCWAGCSNAVMEYYTKTIVQCYIADFAWTRTDCCSTPANCNSPNDMYGTAGSIQGILKHWCVSSSAVANALTFAQCQYQINGNRPFIIRYGWDSGGGHFIVGRGYDTNDDGYLYLMNPWPGEGYGTFTYEYVKKKVGHHTWTHTLRAIKRNLQIADWKVANTIPTKSGNYWYFNLSLNEILGGCGKITRFYWDFYDAQNKFINRQYNTAADFADWFDDCADGDFQLPRRTKLCANLWAYLGGRSSGYVRLSFDITCDSGASITRSKKMALAGASMAEENTAEEYGLPAIGPCEAGTGFVTQ